MSEIDATNQRSVMPKKLEELKTIIKNCLRCKSQLVLKCARDIERKKFCSRSCRTLYLFQCGVIRHGKKHSDATRAKLSVAMLRRRASGYTGPSSPKSKERLSGRGYYSIGRKRTHQIVAESIIGRPLQNNEVVHHIDSNKLNNDPSNLVVMTRSEHNGLHAKQRWANKNA
jgi:hypothetical protein